MHVYTYLINFEKKKMKQHVLPEMLIPLVNVADKNVKDQVCHFSAVASTIWMGEHT